MSSILIGLDIGTSSVKASAFDAKGHLLGKASSPVEVFSPQPGWSEQSPNDWWKSACQVLKEVVKEIDPLQIAAIGLSGQCPGHVLIDAGLQPIGQAIIWRDQRATEEATWLKNNISDSRAMEWTGSGFLGEATSPPARLLWLKKHRPDQVEKSIAIIQPKDFIAAKLTGKIHTDINSAYCLAHPDTGKYDPQYFRTLGFPIEKMPAALKATSLAGEVTVDASRQTGIPAGVKVIIGTIDAYCDNLAGGVIYPGRAVDVAGTSEIVSLAVNRKLDAPGVFPANLDDSGYFLCGPMQSGGDTLIWLANCFYPEFGRTINYQVLEKDAQSVPAGSDGLVFLPYLNGERAPIWDTNARGAFIGLTFAHTRQHCTRAVYESIGYAIRHILEICESAAGNRAKELVICGGGSRSDFWNQMKADILQRDVTPSMDNQTGCLGAAILASVGIGIYPDLKEACGQMIEIRGTLPADPKYKEQYEYGYQIYRSCYPALKPVWSKTQR